jgi:hypothetical protein
LGAKIMTSTLELLVALFVTWAASPALAAAKYGGAAGSAIGSGYIVNAGSGTCDLDVVSVPAMSRRR